MGITRVMAFVDSQRANAQAASFIVDGYKVIRIDKPDIIELLKPGGQSQYWYSDDEGDDADYILIIATKDEISIG